MTNEGNFLTLIAHRALHVHSFRLLLRSPFILALRVGSQYESFETDQP